jgi:hypothetical protein
MRPKSTPRLSWPVSTSFHLPTHISLFSTTPFFCDLFSSPPIIPFNYDLCTFKLTFCQLVLHRSNKQSAKLPFQVSHWLITTPLHMLSWLQRSWPPSQWLALQLSSGRVSKARRSRLAQRESFPCPACLLFAGYTHTLGVFTVGIFTTLVI